MSSDSREEQQGLLSPQSQEFELESLDTLLAFPSSSTLPSASWHSPRKVLGLLPAAIINRFVSSFQRPRPGRLTLKSDHRHFWHRIRLYWLRTVCKAVLALVLLVCTLGLLCAVFFPSYSRPPAHYSELERRVRREPTQDGRANINNERIFIAAALYDPGGRLVTGDWAESVRALIGILGPWNVHLSVYENDLDDKSKAALMHFKETLGCNNTIVQEDVDLSTLPYVTTSDGTRRLKRMQFLAYVRNRALEPLRESPVRFDRLLYLNDIIFNPVDAAHLLFSTNLDEAGVTHYRAACAVDFENPFKFYDTFATRDLDGYGMGVIFYPWFTGAGSATSRSAVLAQRDAVPVTSCWGGMVAFEAKWFQFSEVEGAQTAHGVQLPLGFRAEKDVYWDASECCLIHADLAAIAATPSSETGIYMNPYVRVAYSKQVLDWLRITRRIERLYSPVQSIVNWISGRPTFNPRRLEKPGQEVIHRTWVWNNTQTGSHDATTDNAETRTLGMFKNVQTRALPGSFCGRRSLSFLSKELSIDGKKWSHDEVPEGAVVARP